MLRVIPDRAQVSGINGATSSAVTSCNPKGTNSKFNFHIQGSSGIVCVSNAGTLTTYIGYIQINGKNYLVNMFSFSYSQKLETVKSIFNSLTIK